MLPRPLFVGKSQFKEPSANKLSPPGSRSDRLGVWSAADVLWALCPGLRAAASQERPAAAEDVVGLFYELGPAKSKVSETRAHGRV